MDIYTGEIKKLTESEEKEMIRGLEDAHQRLFQINPNDMTKKERELKKVDLDSDTKLANMARKKRNDLIEKPTK